MLAWFSASTVGMKTFEMAGSPIFDCVGWTGQLCIARLIEHFYARRIAALIKVVHLLAGRMFGNPSQTGVSR
jgi:hypothetical protein